MDNLNPASGAAETRLDHRVVRLFLAIAALEGLAVLILAAWLGQSRPIAAVGVSVALYCLITAFAARALVTDYPHDRLGVCNIVTQARAALTALLLAIAVGPTASLAEGNGAWWVFALALFTLSLDGIDGYFARRSGLVSDFGARFDVEVDSILAVVLALLAWQLDKAGIWVLALGSLRYAFVAASLIWPWLNARLPERFSRKLICVIQIGSLIALIAPPVGPPASYLIALVASALLVWSFAVDIIWLHRHRGDAT
jgi:phosphatidylglycerophosphate synthase